MATGVIGTLCGVGFGVVALEQAAPWCVRRAVCFAEAIYDGTHDVQGLRAMRADSLDDIGEILETGKIPILVDPDAESLPELRPQIVVDGRMLKTVNDCSRDLAPLVIGLGPGFTADDNCHAAIETNRGPNLGRVLYRGAPQAYTGTPSPVNGLTRQRVLRAPRPGVFRSSRQIGEAIAAGEEFGQIEGQELSSPITGAVRGLIRSGLAVEPGRKLGDIDPRGKPERCFRISRKAIAIGEGVLEAVQFLLAAQKNSSSSSVD